jgi:hypothetical protein
MRRLVAKLNSPGQDELNSRSVGLEYTRARWVFMCSFIALQEREPRHCVVPYLFHI